MIKELAKSLLGIDQKAIPLTQRADFNNLLNQILYQYQVNNNGVVWFDVQNREKYIREGYQGNHSVYAIINKIATKVVAGGSPQIFKENGIGKNYKTNKFSPVQHIALRAKAYKRKELEQIEDKRDPLTLLMMQPNPSQSWSELLDLITIMHEATGEAFIYRVTPGIGRNKDLASALYVMPSHLTDLVGGNWREPVSGYKLRIGQTQIEIPFENVLHIKKSNPDFTLTGNQLRGMPPLMAGYKLVTANSAAITALTAALQNEGIKGIVTPADSVAPDYYFDGAQKAKIDQRMEEQANSVESRNRIISAAIPLKFVGIGLNPSNMALTEALAMTDKPLANLWGLNPVLFDPNATLANLEEAKKQLVTDVCVPFLQTLEEKLNSWLVPPFKKAYDIDYTIDFDTTVYPELQPDMKMVKDVYGNDPAFTWNDLRAMLNWEPSTDPNADKHWVPSNSMLSEDFTNMDDGV